MNLESTTLDHFIIYLAIFRLGVLAAGVAGMWLGYRLFLKAIDAGARKPADGETSLTVAFAGNTLTLKGAAPGTFFALFGAGIVVAMFVVGAPGMTLQSIENAGLINPAPAATLAEVDSPPYMAGSLPPDSRATTLTLRSNLTDDISRIENDLESEAITLDEAFRDLLAVIKETR